MSLHVPIGRWVRAAAARCLLAASLACAGGTALAQAPQAPGGGVAAGAAEAVAKPGAGVATAYRLLASGASADRFKAVQALLEQGDDAAASVLRAMADGGLAVAADGSAGWIERKGAWFDAATGRPVAAPVPLPDAVRLNNRLRNEIAGALASLRLFSASAEQRRAAARELQERPDPAQLANLQKARGLERDASIAVELATAIALLEIRADDAATRLRAVEALADSDRLDVRSILERMLSRGADGQPLEPDAKVRAAVQVSLSSVDRRLTVNEYLGRVFAGLSLGSILMLAAMGLAITYGLLGVINMAHGEMIMIGAYCAFFTQSLMRQSLPALFDWYPVLALPVAFVVCAAVGILIERLVIRHLYGRPLETLLATWGISLILIQAVRTIFGPQNVEIENPGWLSGGIAWASLVLPYNRIVIIGFSLAVLAAVWLVLSRTRLGLFVRGVTQNRPMAGAIGVPTAKVDMLAFGLGSGIAGLAGVALSQVGNVGPELGQAYIIDSFIVVVAGGVGQLLGAVVAGFGLGVLSKFIEPSMGAVVTKILILVAIIGFIQRRPQGIFALKSRETA
ncbi:MAG: urea ABC transporter permease subunit UrtB [Lautropia sp.]